MSPERIPISEPESLVPMMAPGLLRLPELECAYTKKERDWYMRVYGGKCHFPVYDKNGSWHICGRKDRIEIHHILPDSFIRSQRPGFDPNSINFPEGMVGIAICKGHHDYVIHPDIGEAIRNYSQDQDSFKKAIGMHKEKAAKGEVFWNNDFDTHLKQIAENKINGYICRHPEDKYPQDPAWNRKPHPPKKHWWDDC